jgi:hypothetical protein
VIFMAHPQCRSMMARRYQESSNASTGAAAYILPRR